MIYIKDGVAIIAVNALHRPNRQRFPEPMNSPNCASTPSPSRTLFMSIRIFRCPY
jgi:hypothetical protein